MEKRQVWIWILIGLFSSGCVSQQGQMARDASFSESSNTGLVMFGVDIQGQYKSPSLSFLRFDPSTGKVDLSGRVSASPRIDKLTKGQKFAAAMTGQDSRPGGHGYFVVNFPPGEWVLYSISGFYNDGVSRSYSSVTNFSEGTIVLSVKAGEASYIGEFVIDGGYGEQISLRPAPPDFAAAQTEIASFVNVSRPLVQGAQKKRFTCTDKYSIVGKLKCLPASVVVID